MIPPATASNLKRWLLSLALLAAPMAHGEDGAAEGAKAVNGLGLDLYREEAVKGGNLILSPYSIEEALAMAEAGAAGDTRREMGRVLHLPADGDRAAVDLAALAVRLEAAQQYRRAGRIEVANRLFLQQGYRLQPAFVDELKTTYRAPLGEIDFGRGPEQARNLINRWTEEHTAQKIKNLLPPGSIDHRTRLVLANAVHLQAAWVHPFKPGLTKPEPFRISEGGQAEVPTMTQTNIMEYSHANGLTAVALPLGAGELKFLVLLPDDPGGLLAWERTLTSSSLLEPAAAFRRVRVILHLPRFELAPDSLDLAEDLRALGIKDAFNPALANFDGMTGLPRPVDSFHLSEVPHKAYVSVAENGVEAAAATAVVMALGASRASLERSVEVRVDHPFFFAIQHVPDGALLFLGQVTDPR